ncbi:ATP-binding protein [Belliella marina]|uniref:histidine kinase n=1 Tax=Belliella marina TaxID=1644146 RepID=A0ABW4VNZ4_9BACT
MVFLADDTFPYNIFYTNQLFDEQIGNGLLEMNLLGLGLDINSYIFKEELIIKFEGKEFSFNLELPQQNGSNYFLFYKGREIREKGLPSRMEAQQFFQNSTDLIGIGQDSFLTWVSDSFTDVLGYVPDELVNLDLCQFFHEEDLTLAKDFLFQAKNGGGNTRFTARILGKDGLYKHIDWHIRSNNNKFYATGRVVPEQQIKRAQQEKQLLEELGLFKELFDLSPEAILITGVSGEIVFTNQQAQERLGIFDGIVSRPMINTYDSKFTTDAAWISHVKQLEQEKSIRYRSELIHTKGKEFPVEVSCNLIEVHGEKYIISFSRDITERIQLEKSLQDSSDFLLHLTEQVPGALYQFVLDRAGEMKFSYLSPGIKTIFDLGENEINSVNDIGLIISKIHPEDIAKVLMTSVASAKKSTPWSCQFRVRNNGEGGYKWVMGAAKPECMESGDVVWYGYLSDITEQKEFEESLKHAREVAEKASSVKSEFLSMISHELRTPLNAISGSVYSLLQDDHTSAQKSALTTINFAVDNLIIMINDLLDFQKIEAGKLNLEMNPLNVEEVIRQVVKGLEFHANDTQNELNMHLDEAINMHVLGDKVRLAQIMNNLITNALKFTQKGKVDVFVKLKSIIGNKVNIYFEVRDTGIGIANEHLGKIFDDFDQIHHSFSKKYGGTGLGLSITKKLLNRMNSNIQVESEIGVGTSFYFEIEFEKVSLLETSIVNNVPKHEADLSSLKILMAEDNDVNALVLGKIIKKWGFQHDRVVNGKEAIDAVESGGYDVVLMDIQMPVMDGFEATSNIKSFSSIPVIALTAAAKLELIDDISKIGFDGLVSKPIDAEELFKKIKEVLMLEI